MVITSAALCRVLNIKESDWAIVRKVCAPALQGIERKRVRRGRTPSLFLVPDVITVLDRVLPTPLSRDTIQMIFEQSEPL